MKDASRASVFYTLSKRRFGTATVDVRYREEIYTDLAGRIQQYQIGIGPAPVVPVAVLIVIIGEHPHADLIGRTIDPDVRVAVAAEFEVDVITEKDTLAKARHQ